MAVTLGIDVACRAAHQATFAVDGRPVWRGRQFFTRPAELDRLWEDLDLEDPGELTVVVEPTRNAWMVLAQWFRARGARVVMVPTTQSADLRAYYSKHAKNDRLDSEVLARLPLLHPEGLREFTGDGPADPLRRLVKQRSTMVKRRTVMGTPVTAAAVREAAQGLLAADGVPVTVCRDSPGFIAQRIVAMIVNIGCSIAQSRTAGCRKVRYRPKLARETWRRWRSAAPPPCCRRR